MTNPVHDLTTYSGDDWDEYLEGLALREIFKDLIAAYQDKPSLVTCIIRYILWTYSKDSPKIILGEEWQLTRQRIFEAASLPPTEEMKNSVLELNDQVILKTIQKWINFQDHEVWKELMMLKELKLELQMSANSPIKKANGEIDYETKFKNAKYSIELTQLIKDAESRLLQNDIRLKESIKEVKKSASKNRVTISPETFSKTYG